MRVLREIVAENGLLRAEVERVRAERGWRSVGGRAWEESYGGQRAATLESLRRTQAQLTAQTDALTSEKEMFREKMEREKEALAAKEEALAAQEREIAQKWEALEKAKAKAFLGNPAPAAAATLGPDAFVSVGAARAQTAPRRQPPSPLQQKLPLKLEASQKKKDKKKP